MADIALTDGWDIAFIDGDIAEVTGGHLTRQNSKFRLQIIAGELFEDTRAGVPWLTDMVDPRVSMDAKKAILRANIVKSFGCISVDSLSVVVDGDVARVDFAGTCSSGQFEDALVIYRGGQSGNDIPEFGAQARIIYLPAIDSDYTTTFTMYGSEPVLCIAESVDTGNSCEIVALGNIVIYTESGQLVTFGNGAVTLPADTTYGNLHIYIYQPFPQPQKTVTLSFVIDVTDEDALALFDRMTVDPSDELKEKIDTLIKSLKDADIWDDLDALYVAAMGETEQARLLDWKADRSATLEGANSATNSACGFEVGANSYVDTKYNPARDAVNVTQNSHTTFAWVTKLPDYTGGSLWHPVWGRLGNTSLLRAYDSDYRLNARANNAEISATAAEAELQAGELYAVGRDGASSSAIYKGSTAVKTSSTASAAWSVTTDAYNQRILDLDSDVDLSGGVGVWGMGAYLDTTKLAALKSAIQVYVS